MEISCTGALLFYCIFKLKSFLGTFLINFDIIVTMVGNLQDFCEEGKQITPHD